MSNLKKLPPTPDACLPKGVTDQHGGDAFRVRFGTATLEATKTNSVPHTTNGDEARYSDKSGTYTKCLAQETYGVVKATAFKRFKTALGSGVPADFEVEGLLGAGRKLNGAPWAHLTSPWSAPTRSTTGIRSCRLLPRWPALSTQPSWSSSIGLRCCAMSRSRITLGNAVAIAAAKGVASSQSQLRRAQGPWGSHARLALPGKRRAT